MDFSSYNSCFRNLNYYKWKFFTCTLSKYIVSCLSFSKGIDSLKRDKKNDGLANIVIAIDILDLAIFILITRLSY